MCDCSRSAHEKCGLTIALSFLPTEAPVPDVSHGRRLPVWPMQSRRATAFSRKEGLRSPLLSPQSVFWNNPDYSTQDEERIVSWMGRNGWMPPSWKGRT